MDNSIVKNINNVIVKIPFLRKMYIIIFIILILIAVLLSLINPSNYITENVNISMYVSLILLFLFAYFSSFYKEKNILNKSESLKIYYLRQNIFIISLFFIISVINLLILNPYGIGETYKNILIIILSISFFLSFIVFISFSKYIDDNVNISSSKAIWNTIYDVMKYLSIGSILIVCFFVFITFVLKWFNQESNDKQTLIGKITTYLFLILLIGLIIKYVVIRYLESLNNTSITIKIINNVIKILFFIPCFFIYVGEYLTSEYKQTKSLDLYFFTIILIVYAIIILIYYIYPFFAKKYYVNGSSLLLNKAIGLDNEKVIASYLELYDDKINKNTGRYNNYYNYAISFWFYLDSLPPNTKKSYNKDTIILNYGYNPFVTYNFLTNSLKVSLMDIKLMNKCSDSGIELNKCIGKISNEIYVNNNIKLQKWNNMVLVFSSGTLDIFYNNVLVKSGIGAPNISSLNPLIVGSENGLSGGICNVLYFKKKISLTLLDNLYNSVKNKNPPIGNYNFKI